MGLLQLASRALSLPTPPVPAVKRNLKISVRDRKSKAITTKLYTATRADFDLICNRIFTQDSSGYVAVEVVS